jgi:hypothetical protein
MKSRKKGGILSSKDIMKGFTALKGSTDIYSLAPVQCLSISEKTPEWIKHNADWYENVAIRELPRKAFEFEKKYNLSAGIINKKDYIYDPNNEFSNHLGVIDKDDTTPTLTSQFFPIAPPIIKTLMGEYLKRDEKIIVDAIDPDSKTELLEFKEKELKNILVQQAIERKRIEMIKEGLIPSEDPQSEINQQIQKELDNTQKIVEIENKFKKFRTIAAQWGQHFIAKYDNYNYMDGIKSRMFLDSLAVDECIFGLDLLEDGFKPLYLEPKKTYVNISPSKTNYSDANFVVNIEFMSIPEIINTFRNHITDEQLELLELKYNGLYTKNVLLGTDDNGIFGSGYYDPTKSYNDNMKRSVNSIERASDASVSSFINSAVGGSDMINSYSHLYNNQKLIRVSRIWWASQRRICKLTRIIEGEITVETVDENFLITVPPVYDNSLLKEKTSKTLISGEHIDSTFIPEWRYVVKIGQNIPYNIINPTVDDEDFCIYLFGEPLPFQRKSNTNKYDAKPPITGGRISDKSTMSISLIDQLKPWQIIYNVVNNKIVKLLPWDIGPILSINESSLNTNSLNQEDGTEPLFEALNNMRENRLIVNKDLATGVRTNGTTMQNQVMDVSTIGKIAEYLNVGQQLKLNAFESIGFTRERLASASQNATATGINQSIETSFTQTEYIFDTFSNKIMPEVYQMILDYGQYYTTKSDVFSDTYINDNLEKVFFKSLKNDLLLKDLHVRAFSKASMRKKMDDLKNLMIRDNTMGATFLDKIKGLHSDSPSEIIEKLEKAEAERIEREQQKQELELQKQREQQEFLEKQRKEDETKQDERFYANLENDRYLAEVKSMGYANDNDIDTNKIPDSLEVDKFKQGVENDLQKQLIEQRKLRMQQNQNDSALELQREKLNIEREKLASNERIARENKNSADLKFVQMQRNKK